MTLSKRKPLLTAGAMILTVLTVAGPAMAAGGAISPEEKKIFEEKCSPCHSTARILNVAPDKVRETIARMETKNPSLFEDVSGDRLAEIAARMMEDPRMVAQRKAMEDAVAKGKALFGDKSLGRNGKSCGDCHTEDSLRGAAGDYPKYNEKQGRLMSLMDTVNLMISGNMAGKVLPQGDERTVALEAYLKSLR